MIQTLWARVKSDIRVPSNHIGLYGGELGLYGGKISLSFGKLGFIKFALKVLWFIVQFHK